MEVKGSVLLTIPMCIKKQFGRDGHDRWIDALDADTANAYGVTMSSSKWYPLREYLETPMQICCDQFYGGDIRGARDLGRFNAEYSLKGAYAIFMKVGSVRFIMGRAAKILPMYYRPSTLGVINATDTSCELLVSSFPDISPIIEHRIAGWVEGALEIHGCTDIEVAIEESLAEGAPHTRFRASWK